LIPRLIAIFLVDCGTSDKIDADQGSSCHESRNQEEGFLQLALRCPLLKA
jgi:hypothetical protein